MATPNLALFPSGRKATKLYSVLPTDGTGDFTVSRASKKNEINSDLKLEIIANDVPSFNFDTIGGCPVLNTEPQATNLITYPISFGNSYWTKIGATIEGDPSTAGSELVTNGVFATDTDWTKGTGWTIGSGVASYDAVTSFDVLSQSLVTTITQQYEISFEITSGTARIAFTEGTGQPILTGYANYGVGTHTLRGSSIQSGTALRIYALNTDGGLAFSIDNISVKELTGYSAPSVDFPTSAFKLVESALDDGHYIYRSLNYNTSSTYTFSFFAKKAERSKVRIFSSTGFNGDAVFDLENGTVFSTVGGTAKIKEYNNGWFLCQITGTTTRTSSVFFMNPTDDNGASIYQGDGTSGVYLFMAQLEAGSVATSPTFTDITLAAEGSTTTRLADVVNGAGDVNTFNSPEGTLYAEISAFTITDTIIRTISLSDGSTNFVVFRYDTTTNSLQYFLYVGGSLRLNGVTTLTDVTDYLKVAMKWKVNDFAIWVNGVEIATATGATFTASTLDRLDFTEPNGTNPFAGNTKSVQVYNTMLTDAELLTLTTL